MVIHLGFVSQAEGGETKAATQNGFSVSILCKIRSAFTDSSVV